MGWLLQIMETRRDFSILSSRNTETLLSKISWLNLYRATSLHNSHKELLEF